MHTRLRNLSALAVCVAAVVLATSVSVATAGSKGFGITHYSVTVLPNVNDVNGCVGAPPPPAASVGNAINIFGQVVGTSYYCDAQDHSWEAVRWTSGSVFEFQPVWATLYPNSFTSSGLAINDFGTIVGRATHAGFTSGFAFVYRGGTVIDLGSFAQPGPCDPALPSCFDGPPSAATAVNDLGQVAGWSNVSISPANHAFLYTGGVLHDLGTLGGTNSAAADLNEFGVIVGTSDTVAGSHHAFATRLAGPMRDLGTLGGANSAAAALNLWGQIVGNSELGAGPAAHAFIYSFGLLHDLGTLGGTSSAALGINDLGTIVGQSTTVGDVSTHAFVDVHGVMRDLNTLVPTGTPTLVSATGVNDFGQIVANDAAIASPTGPPPIGAHTYVLTPVP
jgi:probable HAF family extracellular repeat protein